MSIDKAVKQALKSKERGGDFGVQLKSNRDFQRRMENAGVITRKQAFTIPLMERIARFGQ
jgi:hypothetical protein